MITGLGEGEESQRWPSWSLLMVTERTLPEDGCFYACRRHRCRSLVYPGWILHTLCPVWTALRTWKRERENLCYKNNTKETTCTEMLDTYSSEISILIWFLSAEAAPVRWSLVMISISRSLLSRKSPLAADTAPYRESMVSSVPDCLVWDDLLYAVPLWA